MERLVLLFESVDLPLHDGSLAAMLLVLGLSHSILHYHRSMNPPPPLRQGGHANLELLEHFKGLLGRRFEPLTLGLESIVRLCELCHSPPKSLDLLTQ